MLHILLNTISTDQKTLIDTIGAIIAIITGSGAIITGTVAFSVKALQWWRTNRDCRLLRKRPGAKQYTDADIRFALQYYIKPDCQDVDPTQEEEIRLVHGVRSELFREMDKMLSNSAKYKYIIVLADSGMGKTSFVLNYYVHHLRHSHRQKQFHLAIVHLGAKDADSHITDIPDKQDTTLFLDAFDEDVRAIKDHKQRVHHLLELCSEFRQVLITSRTQFFPRSEEIPSDTGILKVSIAEAGQSKEYKFYKLYLSPFSDEQVDQYLKCRFSFWKRKRRKQARIIAKKIQHLTARPMLLAHIRDLMQSGKTFAYAFELYEEMVEVWLEREKYFVKDKNALREFSECMALDLYLNREKRGAERVPYTELTPIAQKYNMALPGFVWVKQ